MEARAKMSYFEFWRVNYCMSSTRATMPRQINYSLLSQIHHHLLAEERVEKLEKLLLACSFMLTVEAMG